MKTFIRKIDEKQIIYIQLKRQNHIFMLKILKIHLKCYINIPMTALCWGGQACGRKLGAPKIMYPEYRFIYK